MASNTTLKSSGRVTTTATASTGPVQNLFTLFPKLPPELRYKIWSFAIPDPRVITIEVASDPTHPCSGRYPFFSKTACFPTCDHIGMLSACGESRRIAQKVYKFRHCLHPRYPIPFDSSRDTVFMDISTLSAFLKPRFWKCPSDNLERIGIKTLALGPLRTEPSMAGEKIPENEFVTFESLVEVLRRAVRDFKKLEEIIFCWMGEEGEGVVDGVSSYLGEDMKRLRGLVESRPGWKLSDDARAVKVPRILSLKFGVWEDADMIRDKLISRKMRSERD